MMPQFGVEEIGWMFEVAERNRLGRENQSSLLDLVKCDVSSRHPPGVIR